MEQQPRLYKFCLWKAYFDKGLGLTNYIKYAVALFAIKLPLKVGIIAGVGYAFLCLILGKIWYKYEIISTEVEIGNIINPFVKEMREKLNIKGRPLP